MTDREVTDHIYAPTKDRDEVHRRTIKNSINRGNVVMLHRHEHGQDCRTACQRFEPWGEGDDGTTNE